MLVEFMKSKIQKATITQTEIDYEGSITIDSKIMKAAGILPNEKVVVLNFQNKERFETYAILGKAGSGVIGLNGPAALLGKPGQQVIILSYALLNPAEARKHKPSIVYLNGKNSILKVEKKKARPEPGVLKP